MYDLLDFESIPTELKKLVNNYPLHLIDINNFENTDALSAGVVKSVSAPCLIMEKADSDNIRLSFCDPDLRVVTSGTIGQMLTESVKNTTKVVLWQHGLWLCSKQFLLITSRYTTVFCREWLL